MTDDAIHARARALPSVDRRAIAVAGVELEAGRAQLLAGELLLDPRTLTDEEARWAANPVIAARS